MKIKFIIILLTFCALNSYSQKCKASNDPFTNEVIVSFDYNRKTVFYELKNDVIRFEVIFNYSGDRNYIFGKNLDFYFKLENGKSIVLKSVNESHPTVEQFNSTIYSPMQGGVVSSKSFTAYSFTFNLTKKEVLDFSNSKITIIRVPETGGEGFIDIKAKGRTKNKTKAIKKGATCVLEHI